MKINEKIKNSNAYQIATKRGILDEICSHMEVQHINWSDKMIFEEAAKFKLRGDFKESSPWHAEGDIYKIGITSENLGDKRIYDVAKDAGFTPKIVMLENVGTVMAKRIESKILKLGKPVSLRNNFPGSSEFRHFSSNDLNKAIEIIKSGN